MRKKQLRREKEHGKKCKRTKNEEQKFQERKTEEQWQKRNRTWKEEKDIVQSSHAKLDIISLLMTTPTPKKKQTLSFLNAQLH